MPLLILYSNPNGNDDDDIDDVGDDDGDDGDDDDEVPHYHAPVECYAHS